MAEKAIMTVVNENNEIMDVDVLFTFKNTATDRCYIVYTENTLDETAILRFSRRFSTPTTRP